ncbi:MAG: alpha/beta fold hydrolase BchO [Tateyamaria sp.]|jgi:magnesium chelatase accessory protein|uniref:alpha/beta fold hydrolase BchO n=1 Tax=Tateyamaria sp. TaxID=1929288 RepID=UPI0032DDB899
MDWAKNSATWPHAQHSRFVLCKPHRWHIQDIGQGPLILLIHGAGGATHSWQHLIPILSQTHRIVAVDLPGQGFTQLGAQRRCGLNHMAEDIAALCHAEDLHPSAIIGHSAGAAIALRMAELMPNPQVIGINAALDTFQGIAGVLFPMFAKTIAALPFAAHVFSATASNNQGVARIIQGTGSTLPPADLNLYRRLVGSPKHVQATLQMMAQWQLEPLLARLPHHPTRTLLIAAENDGAVPPITSTNAAKIMPHAQVTMIPKLGHLAHEEDPNAIAPHILNALLAQATS